MNYWILPGLREKEMSPMQLKVEEYLGFKLVKRVHNKRKMLGDSDDKAFKKTIVGRVFRSLDWSWWEIRDLLMYRNHSSILHNLKNLENELVYNLEKAELVKLEEKKCMDIVKFYL